MSIVAKQSPISATAEHLLFLFSTGTIIQITFPDSSNVLTIKTINDVQRMTVSKVLGLTSIVVFYLFMVLPRETGGNFLL